jgi:hypothetical protein
MKKAVHKGLLPVILAALIAALTCIPALAFETEIDIAPKVLNIQSKGEVVTVHTEIPYSDVAASSVLLNGVAIDWWKVDNQGNFVAKFVMNEIKDLPLAIGGYNTLTLLGVTTWGEAFFGEQDIKIIDVAPKGKN